MCPPDKKVARPEQEARALNCQYQAESNSERDLKQACEHLHRRVLYLPITHVHCAQVVCRDCGVHIRWLSRLNPFRGKNPQPKTKKQREYITNERTRIV
jgi:hypothetical protein